MMSEALSEAEKIERVEQVVSVMQETREILVEQKELFDSLRAEYSETSIDDMVKEFVAGNMGRALKGKLSPIKRELKRQAKIDYQNQAILSLAKHLKSTYCFQQDNTISGLLSGHYLRAEAIKEDGSGIEVKYACGRDERDIPGLYPENEAKGKFIYSQVDRGTIVLDNGDSWTVEVISSETGEQQVELEIVH